MKKIFNIIILSLIYLSVFSQAQTFENRESKLIIREKLNNNAGIINTNTADILSIEDSIEAHRTLIDNIETGETADLTPLYDSVSVHRTAIDNLSAMPATNLAPLYDSVFSHRTEIDALNAIPVTNLTPLYDSVAVHRSELDNIEITSITGLADSLAIYTAKETNATHTGDVLGSSELTIASGAVDESKLNASVNASLVKADNSFQIGETGGLTINGTLSTSGIATASNLSGINTGDQDLTGLAEKTNVIEKDNVTVFNPTLDYHPATKKYVDENAGGVVSLVSAPSISAIQYADDAVQFSVALNPADSKLYGTVNVVVIGSSTTAGIGAESGYSCIQVLNNWLDNVSDNVTLTNLALSGQVTTNALPTGYVTTGGYTVNTARNITAALSYNPDIVIIGFPSNDQTGGISVAETMSNFHRIIREATCRGVSVVIMDIAPRTGVGSNYQYPLVDFLNSNYNELYSRSFTEFADADLTWVGQYYNDDIHPNSLAHIYLGEQLIKACSKIFERRSSSMYVSVEKSTDNITFAEVTKLLNSTKTFYDYNIITGSYYYRAAVMGKNYVKSGYSTILTQIVSSTDDPQYVDSEIGLIADNTISITFNRNATISGLTQISLTASGGTLTPSAVVSGNGTGTVSISLNRSITYDETISISITAGSEIVNASTSTPLSIAVSGESVTNNVTVPSPPVYVSSEVGNIGDSILAVTFDINTTVTGVTGMSLVASGGVCTFEAVHAGSGIAVVQFSLSRVIAEGETVSLTVSGTNNITSTSSGISFAGISSQSVVNNVSSSLVPDYTYRLNFGNTNLATSPWMNISSSNSTIETVDTWTTILDENGIDNGVLIGLKAGYPVQETQGGGISYTGADFEANCGLDFLYRDNGSSIYDIAGLPANATVNIKFLSSRNTTSTDRVTLYTIGSETQTLDAAMNSTLIANFDAVANASGVLTFEWGINTGSTYAYLNAMIIEVTNP